MESSTTQLTAADNLRRVLKGEKPAWVPFAPNFDQWFGHHRKNGTLPAEIAGCQDYIAASMAMGFDIFSRNHDGGYREKDTGCNTEEQVEELGIGRRTAYLTPTPYGTLRCVLQEQRAITTVHVEEYPVKDWATDGAAFRYAFERTEFTWDEQPFVRTVQRIGNAGLAMLPLGGTPLKFLHQKFGLDGACLFVADYPDDAKALCDDYWARLRPLVVRAAEHPSVEVVILMDNIDTPFYPPDLARRYWAPYVADAVDIMRARGKYLFVHACGKLAGLAEVFAETRVSGLEGISHAPLGDWGPAPAVACHDRFVYFGGFTPMEQAFADDSQVREFYKKFLAAMPRKRVIFGTSCNTEINTPWERILLMRDLVRAWGGCPALA